MLYYESKLSIHIYKCMDNNYEIFLDTQDNVDQKYELYKNLVKIMLGKGINQSYQWCTRITKQRAQYIQYARVVNTYALALAVSTRSAVNHQHDQIHKYNSSTLLGRADIV